MRANIENCIQIYLPRLIRASTPTNSNPTNPFINYYKYDAARRNADGKLDGNGQQVKNAAGMFYYLRSSVLGGSVVSEVNAEIYAVQGTAGRKAISYVYGGVGEVIAEQTVTNTTSAAAAAVVRWKRRDPCILLHKNSKKLF